MSERPPSSLMKDLAAVTNPRTLVLFGSSLVVPLAAFMLYPFLIIYFTHVLKFTPAEAGLLLSVRFLASGVLGFIGGMAADRIGLGRAYVLSAVVTGLAIFAMSRESDVWVLAALLMVVGVAASTVNATARGLANTEVDQERGGMMQNVIHWLNNVGMAAALPVSAFALGGGYSRIPFEVTAVSYVLIAIVMALVFWRPHRVGAKSVRPSAKPAGPLAVLRDDPAFVWLLVSFLLVVAAEMQFESGVPLDLSFHFTGGARIYGALGALDMVIVFVLQLGVSHWLANRKSPWAGYLGMLAVGGLAIGGVWQTIAGWTLTIILLGVGDVFAFGQILALMGDLPQDGRQGQYFALLAMVQGLATFVAYAASGTLYQTLHPAWLFGLTLPAAGLAAIALRNAKTIHRRQAPLATQEAG